MKQQEFAAPYLHKLCMWVPVSPWRKHELELDQAPHGVQVILHSEAEIVFRVALSLEREHHFFHRRAPPAYTAKTLPQSQRHATECILHI